MLIGINAGFGAPIAHEFDLLHALGFEIVRQDFRPEFTDDRIRRLVTEFSRTPLRLLALIGGGRIGRRYGNRTEPHELADLARRVVRAAGEAGVSDCWIEVGNEPDLAHADYRTRPQDFAVAIQQTHAAVRAAGFGGPVVSGGISNLSRSSLRYLERMLEAGLPPDVLLGFHRYPKGTSPREPQEGFGSRDEEWRALQRLAGGRMVACTEVGHHTAPRRYRMWGLIPATRRVSDEEAAGHLLYDLCFFRERGCVLAVVYQLNDGPSDTPVNRYGIRRRDGTWKPAAEVITRLGDGGESPACQGEL